MEDNIPMSDYEKEKNILDIWTFLDVEESKCCFCKTKMGALIRLRQGWCCVKCFKEIVLKPEVNKPSLSQNNKKEDGFPPTPKGMGIQPTIL